MVRHGNQHTRPRRCTQGPKEPIPEANKINAATPFDFEGKNLTAYGGLLPVATMLEKLGFQGLLEETLRVKRSTRAMTRYQFVLAMVLALYVGFARLHHLRFLQREPMLVGILKVLRLPPQCTFWRFLASLHQEMARQLLEVQRRMRQRVWEAARVSLKSVTLDTDTTVHTLFGHQRGARKGYNPQHRGKKSYQPILSFLAETREYVMGELHNGDRPSGAQIARHLDGARAALPAGVETVYARADSGFYCRQAVESYEKHHGQFIISASKTGRLVEELKAAEWKPSPHADADGQCEFRYPPEGWGQAYRFVALRSVKEKKREPGQAEQYQLFETAEYSYRVFVTNMAGAIDLLVWFYEQRAGAENLIKEANNDAGLAAYPSSRWAMNCNHFQLAMLAYNLNCWLMLFNREEEARAEDLKHTTLATSRLRFLFLAAKIWRHGGRVGISYSDHYAEQGIFQRLMERLRAIAVGPQGYVPVLAVALRC
jgi:Transposase DDE domain group 1